MFKERASFPMSYAFTIVLILVLLLGACGNPPVETASPGEAPSETMPIATAPPEAAPTVDDGNILAMEDGYECDDALASAALVDVGGSQQIHTFHIEEDVDYVVFQAFAGFEYILEGVSLDEGLDLDLVLEDAQGNALAYSDRDGTDSVFRIVWLAPENGFFYVETRGFFEEDVSIASLEKRKGLEAPAEQRLGGEKYTYSIKITPNSGYAVVSTDNADADLAIIPIAANISVSWPGIEYPIGLPGQVTNFVVTPDGTSIIASTDNVDCDLVIVPIVANTQSQWPGIHYQVNLPGQVTMLDVTADSAFAVATTDNIDADLTIIPIAANLGNSWPGIHYQVNLPGSPGDLQITAVGSLVLNDFYAVLTTDNTDSDVVIVPINANAGNTWPGVKYSVDLPGQVNQIQLTPVPVGQELYLVASTDNVDCDLAIVPISLNTQQDWPGVHYQINLPGAVRNPFRITPIPLAGELYAAVPTDNPDVDIAIVPIVANSTATWPGIHSQVDLPGQVRKFSSPRITAGPAGGEFYAVVATDNVDVDIAIIPILANMKQPWPGVHSQVNLPGEVVSGTLRLTERSVYGEFYAVAATDNVDADIAIIPVLANAQPPWPGVHYQVNLPGPVPLGRVSLTTRPVSNDLYAIASTTNVDTDLVIVPIFGNTVLSWPGQHYQVNLPGAVGSFFIAPNSAFIVAATDNSDSDLVIIPTAENINSTWPGVHSQVNLPGGVNELGY